MYSMSHAITTDSVTGFELVRNGVQKKLEGNEISNNIHSVFSMSQKNQMNPVDIARETDKY